MESIAQLDNPNTLTLLIEQNRTVVAPALFWTENRSTNFVGFYDIENVIDFVEDYSKTTSKKRRFGCTGMCKNIVPSKNRTAVLKGYTSW